MSRTFRKLLSGTALGAVLALGALIGPASAGSGSQITFGHADQEGLMPGSNCLVGHAAPSATAHLTWRAADQSLKTTATFATSSAGNWQYCDATATLAVGDRLKLSDGTSRRTFVMPRVTLVVDRVANNFHGLAPANSPLIVWQHCCFSDYYQQDETTSDSQGHWVFDNYDNDVRGGTDSYLDWTGPLGDAVTVHAASPSIFAVVGRSRFEGSATPGQEFRVTLRDGSTNEVKGVSDTFAGQYGEVSGQFLDVNGHPVTVSIGDRVVGHALASDLDWFVPGGSVDANVPDDTVNGTCGDTGHLSDTAVVTVHRNAKEIGFTPVQVANDGSFFADFGEPEGFFYDPANIKHGDRILVSCWLDTGDAVNQSYIVP